MKMKKNIRFVIWGFVLAFLSAFTSCTESNKDLIIGTWTITKGDHEVMGKNWTFREDGSCTCSVWDGITADGRYTVDDDDLSIKLNDYFFEDEYYYQQSTMTLKIKELTDTKMTISGSVYILEYDPFGYSESETESLELSFTKF